MAEPQKEDATPLPLGTANRDADLGELLAHVMQCWDDERRALSRQLHDSLGSSLTALTMHLALLTQKLPQEKALQDRAAQMKQLLLNVIDSNRQTQLKLWNDKLEFLGVNVALKELAEQFGASQPLQVLCSLPEDELECPRQVGVALLRTLEEGLANITAHAGASSVDIVLDDNEDETTLTVKDNGSGPQGSLDGDLSKHGLRCLRERLAAVGGTLTLTANATGGSTLTANIPKTASA